MNAAEPPALSETLKTRIEAALSAKNADERLKNLAAIGSGLALADIAPSLGYVQNLKELRERVVFSEMVLARWSAVAPDQAFDSIARLPESLVKMEAIKRAARNFALVNPAAAADATRRMAAGPARNQAGPLVADIWARSNVLHAWKWAQSLPKDFPREPELYAIRFVWVHSDPVSAIPHVMALPPGETRKALLINIAGAWASIDPLAAWKWAVNLPTESARDPILDHLVGSWADSHPRPALDLVLNQPEPSRERLALVALDRWATQQPEDAMQWLIQLQDDSLQLRGASEVMKVWAAAAPAEAAGWVAKLPSGAPREIAIRSYVDAACDWDPVASTTLAAQLTNASGRLQSVQECLSKWLPRQPAAAQEWIERSNFKEAVKAEWRSGTWNGDAFRAAVNSLLANSFSQ